MLWEEFEDKYEVETVESIKVKYLVAPGVDQTNDIVEAVDGRKNESTKITKITVVDKETKDVIASKKVKNKQEAIEFLEAKFTLGIKDGLSTENNYTLVTGSAVGYHSGAEHSEVAVLPNWIYEIEAVKEVIDNFNFVAHEIDGKHSATEGEVSVNKVSEIDLNLIDIYKQDEAFGEELRYYIERHKDVDSELVDKAYEQTEELIAKIKEFNN